MKKVNYEMANIDKPEEIVKATQKAILGSLTMLIKDLQKQTKNPGLTWDQIYFLLNNYSEKKAHVLYQENEI